MKFLESYFMDQNNQIKDISNIDISQCDLNTWFCYQQPYINLSPYNVMDNHILWTCHDPFEMNLDYYQGDVRSPINDRFEHHTVCLPKKQNNKNITHMKNRFNDRQFGHGQSYVPNVFSKRKEEGTKSDDLYNQPSAIYRDKTKANIPLYEVLHRKNISNEYVPEVVGECVKLLDIEKDFPPIPNCIKNFIDIKNNERHLDFKSALQKPIKVDDTTVIDLDKNIGDCEKTKKKRKRKRKKKSQMEEIKTFELIDDEFPNLDTVQKELTTLAEKMYDKTRLKIASQLDGPNKDTDKRIRKRQLLLILPKGLEGQVRIVEAKSIKKSKLKRNIYQDRMKKPIGLLNPLDLSAPSVKRGKERLTPKVKKPSKLKKAILLCRIQKKEFRENIKKSSLIINNDENSNSEQKNINEGEKNVVNIYKSKMHSKNFREYCNHMVGNNINSIISNLLKSLIHFQDNLFTRDPTKAKIKRRLCFGLREVTKFLNMKKLRLIVIAPDLEKNDSQGGLDDIVVNIIRVARDSSIPCVFGLSRSSLAYLCFKKFRVGAIGVFNYDGAESQVKELLKAVDEATEQYHQLKQIMESITQDADESSSAANHKFQSSIDDKDGLNLQNHCIYVGHSRTPSNALSEPISDIVDTNKSTFNSIFEDQNMKSKDVTIELDEGVEDCLVASYVENILKSVSKLHLKK